MSLNLVKKGILEFLFATLGYGQSALRKKSALLDSLIAIKLSLLDSLNDNLNESHENIKSVISQSRVSKLNEKKNFYYCYADLGAGCFTKGATDSFVRSVL